MVILIRCAEHHPLHKGAGVLPRQCVFQWYSEEPGDCRASNEAVPTHRIFRLYFWKIYATITRFLLFGGNYENPAAHLLRALRQPTH